MITYDASSEMYFINLPERISEEMYIKVCILLCLNASDIFTDTEKALKGIIVEDFQWLGIVSPFSKRQQ